MGRLEAIWIKRFKRGPMDAAERATLIEGAGIEGNANKGGRRQVTVIAREVFERVSRELEADIDPRWRRANLMVSGIELMKTTHQILRIGSCRLEILGETRPCEKMDETYDGLRAALSPEWRGGAFGAVIDGGEICVGDPVEWIRHD